MKEMEKKREYTALRQHYSTQLHSHIITNTIGGDKNEKRNSEKLYFILNNVAFVLFIFFMLLRRGKKEITSLAKSFSFLVIYIFI